MGKFLTGMLIGVGIGMLVAPMPGEDMRRMLSERLQEVFSDSGSSASTGATIGSGQSGQSATTGMSATERRLKNVGETATTPNAKGTLVSQPYEPSYPEYVNPEQNPSP